VHGGPVPNNSITKWDRHLKEIGSAVNQKLPESPRTFNKDEEHSRQVLLRSLLKLICRASKQLHLSHSTVHNIAHNIYIYMRRNCSCGSTSNQLTITAETNFVKKCCRKFHLNGINTRNCKIGDSQPPREINEHMVWYDGSSYHWTFLLPGSNYEKSFVNEHVRILHNVTIAL
jgi:hypothetical protein